MGQPPRSRNKLEMRQIAREKEETTFSTLENVTRRVAAWRGRRIEYRKRDAEEGREGGRGVARGWRTRCKKEKVKKDKTEDEATQEGRGRERERERNKGGMTTRMARSYSLGYNGAVLGQCKLNESFSPRRGAPTTSPPSSPPCSSRSVVVADVTDAAGHAAL